jgi:archaellum component FlaC
METHEKINLLRQDLKVLEQTNTLLWEEIKKVRKHESDESTSKWTRLSDQISTNQVAITQKKQDIETLLNSLQTNLFPL